MWTTVILEDTPLPASAIRCLANLLPGSRVRVLRLANVDLGDTGMQTLAAAFPYCKTLHTVNFSKNGISKDGYLTLARALPTSGIVSLDLSYNPIGADISAQLVYAGCGLTHLVFTATNMGQTGFETLCSALMHHGVHLKRLCVSENNITDVGCIASLIAHPRSVLRELVLSHNDISSVAVLQEAISLTRTLRVLSLMHNVALGDSDIVDAFLRPDTAMTNFRLQHIMLSGTSVSDHVRSLLADRLQRVRAWRSRVLIALCTAKVPRFGAHCSAVKKLPHDIMCLIADLLPVDRIYSD